MKKIFYIFFTLFIISLSFSMKAQPPYCSIQNMVRQTTAKGGIVQFDVSNLPYGIYFVHIYDGINNDPEIVKVIIEH